jgi:acetyltransferase-like isoleucine patch superfamily enzyme
VGSTAPVAGEDRRSTLCEDGRDVSADSSGDDWMDYEATETGAAIRREYEQRRAALMEAHRRALPFGDMFTDRWERARFHGFGEGTSVYDNVVILGDVSIGRETWVGPGCVLDGSGGLTIGDYCSISAGVQIYTHDTVDWSLSFGEIEPAREATMIGSGVYLGPNVVIQKGVRIGDRVVVGAMSLVNTDVPSGSRAWGVPARIQELG